MEESLKKALTEIGLEYYYLRYPQDKIDCIVYSYSETAFSSSDDEEDAIKYNVYLNLYCNNGIKLKSKNIKSVMRKHGFIKLDIPPAFISDKSDIINQAFNYIYIESI